MPNAHARLGPSSSERWMSCPASVRLSESLNLKGSSRNSPYALEGTNAHTLAELTARRDLLGQDVGEELLAWRQLVTDNQAEEMTRYVAGYVDFLRTALAEMPNSVLLLEQRVETGVPQSWGTADAIIVSPSEIRVVDFKYGQGVPVEAAGNPQLMLYAVGALEGYGDLLGEVETVTCSVYQPRINHSNSSTIAADALRAWRDDEVAPAADEALNAEEPRFGPSEAACRFCPAAGDCLARTQLVLAEFSPLPEEGVVNPDQISADQLADLLAKLPDFKNWLAAIEEAALRRAYTEGEHLPGWKVVMSGGRRTVKDETLAIQTLIDHGYNAEQVARLKLKTLGDLDKLVGSELKTLLNGQLVRSEGRPAMVPMDDKRPAVQATQEMFAGDLPS